MGERIRRITVALFLKFTLDASANTHSCQRWVYVVGDAVRMKVRMKVILVLLPMGDGEVDSGSLTMRHHPRPK